MSGPFGQGPFGDGGMPDLAAMFESMGRMMRQGAVSGSVDWQAARETATGAIPTSTTPTSGHTQAASQAQSLADLWLDQVTTLSAPGTRVRATTARGWLDATFSSWQSFVEPVADGVAAAMSSLLPSADSPTTVPAELLDALPEEMRDQVSAMLSSPDFAAMTQQVSALANSMGASMFGTQFGKALADMSSHVCSASDVGIPLTSEPLIMVSNLESMANDLSVPVSDVVLFATLRELAHQRLFTHAPWVGSQITAALHSYASGVTIDHQGMQAAISTFDPANPGGLEEALTGGIFTAQPSPAQRAALVRLETMLALVEGWVEVTVHDAIANRLASVGALEEAFRRRRANGGPAEKLFAGLVGLELHPRRIREAAALWRRAGVEHRDSLWAHPDLLPTAADLEDADNYQVPQTLNLMNFLDAQNETSDDEKSSDN